MSPKPLVALTAAPAPLLEALARAPVGAPESDDERDAVMAAVAEAAGGAQVVEHDDVVKKLGNARR